MGEMLDSLVTVAFWAQVLRITMPYLLSALGGVSSERSGVINLALEGKLLLSAFAAAVAADATQSVLVGALAGAAGGMVVAALYGLVVIRLRADQIVAGVAINLLSFGLTRFLLKLIYGSTSNSPPTPGFEGPLWGNPLFWAALLLVPVLSLVMGRTRFGLRLRASGEHPQAATSLGVSVPGTRWRAVLLAGLLAGLGGSWLALDNHGFTAEMSGGRGYIALAAVIMGKWRPVQAALACLLFGFAETTQLHLQGTALGIPGELVRTLPYLLTMVALAGFIGRSRAPSALGKPHLDE
jgi:simple sugar transport system permease protein